MNSTGEKQKMLNFLKKYDACSKGLEWADKNAESLEHGWNNPATPPGFLIWLACETPILSDLEKHRFGLWCARSVQHLMTDPRSIAALDVKERWIAGEASDEELQVAQATARDAARDAARSAEAARAAAWEAAGTETQEAAVRVAQKVAWAAAWEAEAAAYWAAKEVAWSAAWTAGLVDQAAWLRENTKPNFEVE